MCKLLIDDDTTMPEHLGNKNYGGYFMENIVLPFDPKDHKHRIRGSGKHIFNLAQGFMGKSRFTMFVAYRF